MNKKLWHIITPYLYRSERWSTAPNLDVTALNNTLTFSRLYISVLSFAVTRPDCSKQHWAILHVTLPLLYIRRLTTQYLDVTAPYYTGRNLAPPLHRWTRLSFAFALQTLRFSAIPLQVCSPPYPDFTKNHIALPLQHETQHYFTLTQLTLL